MRGALVDSAATVRALLEPTLTRHRALTDDARAQLRQTAATFGYQLVDVTTKDGAAGGVAVVELAPLLMVRRVVVDMKQKLTDTLLDEEVRRRLRLRVGAYLPWDGTARACALHEEERRAAEYLRDEGYFDAEASIVPRRIGGDRGNGVEIKVVVRLGPEYLTDVERIGIPDAAQFTIDPAKIRKVFVHERQCVFGYCWGIRRFTRAQHTIDVQKVVQLFHANGYPAVRVRSNFDPAMSIDRPTRTVRFDLAIDPRRKLDVVFEGHRPGSVSNEELKGQLTFNKASSIDDVEAAASARAIASLLQSRGYFDARVTWSRERFPVFDRVIFRIDQGQGRSVKSVELVGNRALPTAALAAAIGTRPARLSRTLFGASTAVTSAQLDDDVERLVELYRREGYREARVRVTAATDPSALDSAAVAAATLLAERGSGLHVRFAIDEGRPTLLEGVVVELGDRGDLVATAADHALCRQVLRDLAELHGHPGLATPTDGGRCAARATDLAFREDRALDTKDQLRSRLFGRGRARAEVAYEAVTVGPHRVVARYKLAHLQELRVGKVVIRGNFRTRPGVIHGELRLREGEALTADGLAEGARRLRNTALFDAVNITMPDLEAAAAGAVNAVVEVTERYDQYAELGVEAGYSSFNGVFARLIPSFKNLFGVGISLDLIGTVGFDVGELVGERDFELRQLGFEARLRLPKWLSPRVFELRDERPLTDLTAFHRQQNTPRFGLLRTTGATAGLLWQWERPRLGARPARALTLSPHYDFRSRERNVDALRPIGADADDAQVPITTRTGSVGLNFAWEQRVDRQGILQPLAPETGFRLDLQASFASPYLLGQNTFFKLSGALSRFWSLGPQLVLRTDARFDQGFPLGGDALLPEVERFFAGGDTTVRGYDDDRLATEVVQVGVPPLDNVQQIRILPAGGNIRVLGSVDAQLRVYKVLATALFVDAGMITNQWSTVTLDDIRPSVGMALVRVITPFGAFAFERAIPLRPKLGDDPRGRWHISFAARAQF